MAYSDYDQPQIISQIQAFLQYKQENDPAFPQQEAPLTVNGTLGEENSQTNQAINSWLTQKKLTEAIRPDDPHYLEKVYNAIRVDVITDPAMQRALQDMAIMPDFLDPQQQTALRGGSALLGGYNGAVHDPANQRAANALAAYNIKNKHRAFSVDGMDDDETLDADQKTVAGAALDFLKKNGYASTNLLDMVGEDADTAGDYKAIQGALRNNADKIKAKAQQTAAAPAESDGVDIFLLQMAVSMSQPGIYDTNVSELGPDNVFLSGDSNDLWSSPALNMIAKFAGVVLPALAVVPEPVTAKPAPADEPPTPSEDPNAYATYFMNNIVLTSGEYSIHSQRAWHKMEMENLEPGVAIDAYVAEYAEKYKAANDGKELSIAEKNAITQPMIQEMDKLLKIEAAIQNIRPTPELIANNFIDKRVFEETSKLTQKSWHEMQTEGLSIEEVINRRMTKRNDPANDDPNLRQTLTREITAVKGIHDAIIAYENTNVTAESTLEIMQQSWAKNTGLPNSIDHYSDMLTGKIETYTQGGLDQQTACARAAVDVRAAIDRDSGVPEQVIVDENHAYYQSDIQQMGDWLRDTMFKQNPEGKVTPEMQDTFGTQGMKNASSLDFYTSMYGGGYRIYRRSNVDAAMYDAYEEKAQNVHAADDKITKAQVALAGEVLEKHGAELKENEDALNEAGMRLESPEALAFSIRDPQTQDNMVQTFRNAELTGKISTVASADMAQLVIDINELEAQRETPGIAIAPPQQSVPAALEQPTTTSETPAAPEAPVATVQPTPPTADVQVSLEAQQLQIAAGILQQHGAALKNHEDVLERSGIDVSSPETLRASMQDPANIINLSDVISGLPPATQTALENAFQQVQKIEYQRSSHVPVDTAPTAIPAKDGLAGNFDAQSGAAVGETAPQVTATFDKDIKVVETQLEVDYYKLKTLSFKSIDDRQFSIDAESKYNAVQTALKGDDPAAQIQTAHTAYNFIAQGLEKMYERTGRFSDWLGGNDKNEIQDIKDQFEKQKLYIEGLAQENKIELESSALAAATPGRPSMTGASYDAAAMP